MIVPGSRIPILSFTLIHAPNAALDLLLLTNIFQSLSHSPSIIYQILSSWEESSLQTHCFSFTLHQFKTSRSSSEMSGIWLKNEGYKSIGLNAQHKWGLVSQNSGDLLVLFLPLQLWHIHDFSILKQPSTNYFVSRAENFSNFTLVILLTAFSISE